MVGEAKWVAMAGIVVSVMLRWASAVSGAGSCCGEGDGRVAVPTTGPVADAQAAEWSARLAQIHIGKSKLADVKRVFGKPFSYVWGGKTFKRMKDLPPMYIMLYPNEFNVVINAGCVSEIRFEGPSPYRWRGAIQVGSPLADVLKVVGPLHDTVVGKKLGSADRVLYKGYGGNAEQAYLACADQGVRFFFRGDRVSALHLTADDLSPETRRAEQVLLNEKVAKLHPGESTLADVEGLFGKPARYTWDGKTFT